MPQLVDLSHLGWGIDSFPACMLDTDFAGGTAPVGSCNPVEITLRQSFRRVVDRDYEPAEWDGYRFRAYGAFVRERFGYARNYGMSDAKWQASIDILAGSGDLAKKPTAKEMYNASVLESLNEAKELAQIVRKVTN